MKTTFLILLTMPVLANCAGITTLSGTYDKKEDSSISSRITIDVSKISSSIDKKFYGSHIDSYSEMPEKALVDELQLGKIRVGGNEFDVNNWKINKSINSKGEVINVPSIEALAKSIGNYNVDGIFQINLTGFQPELVNNSYVIKRSFTADSAYEMIKTLNGKLNLKIADISLGNEFSIWNETHPKIWPSTDGISADEYIERYISYALAIRKAQEEVTGNANSIKIWGPEISTSWYDWNTGNFDQDCHWTDIKGQVACSFGGGKFTHFLPYFFSRLKDAEKNLVINPKGYKLLDFMAIHYYPNFRTNSADPSSIVTNEAGQQKVAEILESTRVFNDTSFTNKIDISSFRNTAPNILGRVKDWMKAYPAAKLAMNEFAVDSDYRTTTYHPIIRPLYLADSIGIFAKEGVAFLNQFQLSSSSEAHLPWSMIEGGKRSNLFFMYKLYTNYFKGSVLSDVTDNMGDVVNSYATLQGDLVNLSIVNKEPASRKIQVFVKNGSVKKLITVTVPGWSSTIIRFNPNPGLFTKTFEIFQYGAKEMGIPLDPK